MKYYLFLLFVFLIACSSPEKQASITVIPQPNSITQSEKNLTLDKDLTLNISSPGLQLIAENFSKEIAIHVQITLSENSDSDITLLLEGESTNEESYSFSSSKKGIKISSSSEKGIFYGLQTLKQLIFFAEKSNGKLRIPAVEIKDEPRFTWRGIMLDESRHFFGVEKVKQLIDLMALHKLNVFHWHLTDAPGWRIEIKQYPKLTTVGGLGNDIDANAPAKYYTQEEIKEIVAYATERFIEVIPEIDMPGHASAANRAYPEFSGGGSKSHPEFTFNPGYEGTYTYLTNILREVKELFPSKYIHFGGDEVHYGNENWNYDKQVQKLMEEQDLDDLKEVESYFVHRMADSIKMLEKTAIGWDEIVDHNLPNDNAFVMWWRHDKTDKLEQALSGNYPTILCPRIPLYFDFIQDDSHEWGRRWKGAFSTMELTYSFPPDTLPGIIEYGDNVKGIQANIWTERIQNNKRLDFMTHPRLSAMAEAAWTYEENKNLDDFKSRLPLMLNYFERENVYFYNPFNQKLSPEPVGVDKRK